MSKRAADEMVGAVTSSHPTLPDKRRRVQFSSLSWVACSDTSSVFSVPTATNDGPPILSRMLLAALRDVLNYQDENIFVDDVDMNNIRQIAGSSINDLLPNVYIVLRKYEEKLRRGEKVKMFTSPASSTILTPQCIVVVTNAIRAFDKEFFWNPTSILCPRSTCPRSTCPRSTCPRRLPFTIKDLLGHD